MTSLTEVAAAAGVSVSTASRVLTGSRHPIAAATRAKVMAAADELGYSPSALAQALVSRRSRLLGVLVSDIANPYFSVIARGVDDMASRAGYVTMLSHVDRRTATEIDRLRAMRDYSAAGVIIAGSGFDEDPQSAELAEAVATARGQGVQLISLAPRDLGCATITADATAAAHEVTDHLISLGHRRIAYVEGPAGMIASRQRRTGFDAAMAAAGLSDAARHCPGGFDFEAGHAAAMRMIARPPLPEAIVAANDEAAVGALNALRQAGIDVPGEISVAGLNDLPVAQFVGLTTVSLPLYEMGAMAARQIIDGTAGGDATTLLSHRLVARDTTARPRPA